MVEGREVAAAARPQAEVDPAVATTLKGFLGDSGVTSWTLPPSADRAPWSPAGRSPWASAGGAALTQRGDH